MSDVRLVSVIFVTTMACSSAQPLADEPAPVSEPTSAQEPASEEREFEGDDAIEPPLTAEIADFDGETYSLSLYDDGASVQSLERYAEAGAEPRVHDVFETDYCGSSAVVVIVASDISTAISTGTVYDNLVFGLLDQTLIAQYSGAEVVDRDDGSVVSDDQPELERSLRDGIDSAERCGIR